MEIKIKAILIITILCVAIFSSPIQANLGGNIGIEYNSIREQINWKVGINYQIDKLQIGFDTYNFTSSLQSSNTPPFVGFAPMSTYYLWYISYEIENITLKVDRFCEHWMKQSGEYNDYVGYKFGVEYNF